MVYKRIDEEKLVVEQMVHLYCQKLEGHAELCPNCKKLLEYAFSRLDRCRYGVNKPTCKQCPIHCYRPKMRERIRTLMRWSGPWMILYHPLTPSGICYEKKRIKQHLNNIRKNRSKNLLIKDVWHNHWGSKNTPKSRGITSAGKLKHSWIVKATLNETWSNYSNSAYFEGHFSEQ